MVSLDGLIFDEREPAPQLAGLNRGTVHRLDGGRLFVVVDALPEVEHGPCAWSRPAAHAHSNPEGGNTGIVTVSGPPVGTPCLVAFAGPGLADPWVIAFSGWPA